MAKRIYAYFNEDDISKLMDALLTSGVQLFNDIQKQIITLPCISKNMMELKLYSQEGGCVLFTPCIYFGGGLQSGIFYLAQNDITSTSLLLFSQIKAAIRQEFTYSQENSCYYGPGVFDDWLNKRLRLPILLDCDKVEYTSDELKQLLYTLKETSFKVKANDVRVRDLDMIVDLSVPSFIIYRQEKQLVKTIVRKSFIHYEYESACIFVYKNEQKKRYVLMLDRRLSNDSSELKALFASLKK